MLAYLNIVKNIIEKGERKANRTGMDALTVAGVMFEHDMAKGFPLLTTKKMPYRLVASELEFFIKGITDKKWLQERNNHIWDEWCTPLKVPYGHDLETKKKMFEERDLGPLYGWQWRHFGAKYISDDTNYEGQGVDQLKKVVNNLKTDPESRRMLVMAWNPMDIEKVVPPFCHYGFQVTVINNKLNLLWNQRSVDTMLGLPFNIASYGLLLHLLAKEAGLAEGRLIGFLADTHIYINHVEGAKEQLSRDPNLYPLSKVETADFTSIFDWKAEDTRLLNYQSYPKIAFEIAV
ncbi:MAG: thymidylate synthase [Candidatus Magasanikbacteria bacterium]|nr:thymidylate synthase [Candidatus Magasanikbacteria bacterium]